ncbi:hypothetical protein SAMN05216582_11868 [Selenomonas ruminantium]|uniref:Uncharacterized protein n=1 Tax=Selenomonas ruminantium TaxID=971 RepID=A0A1M6VHA5_SELRU|nr:hypothetical protein [Selenomonas ruminantium]SHK80840.1 hypothetical protein SAMN05216582_11868 [Selenomonas ruminantium]
MKTEKIVVSSNGRGMTMALDEVEAFSRSMGFDERISMRARLLAEETMSMVRAIVEDFEADFWMESTEECSCELHLLAVADMNFKKRQDLINTSTHKRNEASVGIMGKIKDFIEGSLFYLGNGSNRPVGDYHMVGCVSYEEIQLWSLEQYRLCLEKDREEGADVDALFDELEKSIVANIADDVRVSVQDNNIEMIIRKNFPIGKL